MAVTLLKCTTRHVRLFTARLENDDLVISDDELTMDLDPDNEFLWSESAVSKVQSRFKELVEQSAGGELSCLLYTSPSPRDPKTSRMPSSA